MQYQYAVFTALVVLFLVGCGSNQATSIGQQNLTNPSHIRKAVEEVSPQPVSPIIPLDGRLRDEHLRMYVSVRIKQEQLRYEAQTGDNSAHIAGLAKVVNPAGEGEKKSSASIAPATESSLSYEKKAIEEFEFNADLYYWAKQTIDETLAIPAIENTPYKKRASNFIEYVTNHNRQMIGKYSDQLRFAQNYKIDPPTSIVQHAAKIGPDVADQPKALILLPAS